MSKCYLKIKILIVFLIYTAFCIQCHARPLTSQGPATPQLLIFVSFSMPEQSLKLWAEQVAKVNGQLLLRGFIQDSLEKTTAKTLALFGKEGNAELLINPEVFNQFKIQMVPAVVVTEQIHCLQEECPIPQFDVVYGDTGLEEALRFIQAKGSSEGKTLAAHFLKQYRANREYE